MSKMVDVKEWNSTTSRVWAPSTLTFPVVWKDVNDTTFMALTGEQQTQLQLQLQQAIVACNERCLYFSAKWYADHQASRPMSDAAY